jgi:Cupin-like domain
MQMAKYSALQRRLASPSPTAIHEGIHERQPFLCDNLIETQTDLATWTLDSLQSRYGNVQVTVESQPGRDPAEHWAKRAHFAMRFSQFADELAGGREGSYLSIWGVDGTFPALADTISGIEALQARRITHPRKWRFPPVLWVGPRASYTLLHRDPADNFLIGLCT